MTFYLAPARGSARRTAGRGDLARSRWLTPRLLCLNLPWDDLEGSRENSTCTSDSEATSEAGAPADSPAGRADADHDEPSLFYLTSGFRPKVARRRSPFLQGKALTPYGTFIASVLSGVREADVSALLAALLKFPTRHTLSTFNLDAANWLDRFQSLGYTTSRFHDFVHAAAMRHNVLCTKPGVTNPGQYLVVCAHFDSRNANLADSTSPAPGADDNGSGSVALLVIASALAAIDTTYSIRFAAFSGEEQGLKGSGAYAADANASGVQIPLLINLDMIGHSMNLSPKQIIVERDTGNDVSSNDAPSQAFANQMVQAAADYTSLGSQLGPIYSSDYMPFEHYGYTCIGVYDGADAAPFYHTSNDTFDKVDLAFYTEVIRLAIATILEVSGKRSGAALVFDPDPITASGNTGLTTASTGLDALRRPRSLSRLAAPTGGNFRLEGSQCVVVDSAPPAVAPPSSADGVFVFSRTNSGFADTMAYFHIDRATACRSAAFRAGVTDAPANSG